MKQTARTSQTTGPTFNQLSKLLVPDDNTYNIKVRYDADKAALLKHNLDYVHRQLNWTENQIKDSTSKVLPFLKYIIKNANPDGNKSKYSTKRNSSGKSFARFGRLTNDNKNKSYISLIREFRNFLIQDIYTDIDIINCHPTIIVGLMVMYEMYEGANSFELFNETREEIFQELINNSKLKGFNRDIAKKIGYIALYDGSLDKFFKENKLDLFENKNTYQLITTMKQSVNKLRNRLKKDFADIWDSIPYDTKKSNREAGKFSSIIQHIERAIMLVIADVAQLKFNLEIGEYCHDGLLLSDDGEPAELDDDFYETVENEVKLRTGFSVRVINKPVIVQSIFEELDDDDDDVDEEKIEELYDSILTEGCPIFNRLKIGFFNLKENEITALKNKILQNHVIRVADDWFLINSITGLPIHAKPLSKTAYNDYTLGTILEKTCSSPSIQIKNNLIFDDPDFIGPMDHNQYFKQLLYDRKNTKPLNSDELTLIRPWIYHCKSVMCRDETSVFDFFVNVLRQKLIRPFEVNFHSCCLVLYGAEGSGKTTHITLLFEKLFGREFINGSVKFKEITKTNAFTNSIDNKLVAVMNEVPEFENNDSFENFKSLITDDHRRSRLMYHGERSVKNTVFYIATTNNRNAFKISSNDRRLFILDVSSKHRNDSKYFKRLMDTINNNYQLIARYILSADIKPSSRIPETSIRKHGKSLNIDSVGWFLQELIESQNFIENLSQWSGHQSEMYNRFKVYCSENDVNRVLSRSKFIGKLLDKYYFDVDDKAKDNKGRPYKRLFVRDVELLKSIFN